MDALVGALRALGEPVVRGADERPARSVRSMIEYFAAAHAEADEVLRDPLVVVFGDGEARVR